MDIDKLFRDNVYEGQSPVEDNLWSNIETKISSTPSSSTSAQTTGAKSFVSQTWNAMSIGAKVVTSIVSVALISTVAVLIVNNIDNTSSDTNNSNNENNIVQVIQDTTASTTINNIDTTNKNTKENNASDINFETNDEEVMPYNIDDAYSPNPPSKIENNTTPSSNVNPKKTDKKNDIPNKVENISHIEDTNKKVDIMIPNYITPNADGINDCFLIRNIDKYPDNTLIIKDRKGKVVFKQSHYNGSFCGENCVVGTYFYILSVKNGSSVKQFTGVVEILR